MMSPMITSRLRKWLAPALCLLFVAQLAVPLWQVWQEENIRRDGLPFKLALRPVDPYDIMRGRYLALAFPEQENALPAPAGSEDGDTVYAVLETGADGLAQVTRLSATPQDNAFAMPLIEQYVDGQSTKEVQIHIPLHRFYLPEDDALAIDNLWRLRENSDAQNIKATLGVRVKNGRIVAESLWLNDQPYREWLREHATQKTPADISSSP